MNSKNLKLEMKTILIFIFILEEENINNISSRYHQPDGKCAITDFSIQIVRQKHLINHRTVKNTTSQLIIPGDWIHLIS